MTFRFEKGTGMYIGGHLSMQNVPIFTSKANKGETGLMYSEIPYIYVGGVFYQDSDSRIEVGTKERPINIYCGSMYGKTGSMTLFTTYGDVYAYDEYVEGSTEKVSEDGSTHAPTGLTTFGSSSGTANLLKWVDSLVNSTDLNFASHTGGSFYSNGRLTISGNGSTFEGDVIVKDKVTIDATGGDVTIGGSLYAGNGLEINTDRNITIEGGIFLGADNVSFSTEAKINDVKYSDYNNPATFIAAVNAAADAEKLNATQAKINAEPSTLFPKAMDKEFLFKGDME